MPVPVKAAIAGGGGPLVGFAVASLVMAFAPDGNPTTGAGFLADELSPLKQGAYLALTSLGGGMVSGDGDTTLRVVLMTLTAISAVVTVLLARRFALPDWAATPTRNLPLLISAMGGALLAVLLITIASGGELSPELRRYSVSPMAALAVAPLFAALFTARWKGVIRGSLLAWTAWIPPLLRGLVVPAAIVGTAWSVLSSAYVVAGQTADGGIKIGQILFDSALHILNAGTTIVWSALALMGIPVRTGVMASPFGTAHSNRISLISDSVEGDTGNNSAIPTPAIVLLFIAILAVALVSAACIHRSVGTDRNLVWRMPIVLAPTAAIFAGLSSWSWQDGGRVGYGAEWDTALIIAAAWAAVVGGLCHPAVASHITANVPALSWSGLGKPRTLAMLCGVAAGLIVVGTVAAAVIQTRVSTIDGTLDSFVSAYKSGSSQAVSAVVDAPVLTGTPNAITDVSSDNSGNATIQAEVIDEPVSVSVDVKQRPDRLFGVFVRHRVDKDWLPQTNVTADDMNVPRQDIPRELTVNGLPLGEVRHSLPGAAIVDMPEMSGLRLMSEKVVIDAEGTVPIDLALTKSAEADLQRQLKTDVATCLRGEECTMDIDLGYYCQGDGAALVGWDSSVTGVTPTEAEVSLSFEWRDDCDDVEAVQDSVRVPLDPAVAGTA